MSLYYIAGQQNALHALSLGKYAGMGNTQEALSAATGDSGRSMGRSNDDPADQVSAAFAEHDQQMGYPADQSSQLPIGSGQSSDKTASNYYQEDYDNPRGRGESTAGGDLSLLKRYRNNLIEMPGGHETSDEETISRSFSFNDQENGVRVLDNAAGAVPSSPAV